MNSKVQVLSTRKQFDVYTKFSELIDKLSEETGRSKIHFLLCN